VSNSVGILGGSFDPPHVGHLAMARAAKDTLGLDKVLLMPAPRPPHKEAEDLSSWEDRLKMVELACDGVDGVEVSRHELKTLGSSYTADMLQKYRELSHDELYFIMGADSLRDLPGWHNPEKIVEMVTLVVFPRDDVVPVLEVQGDASVVVFETPSIDVSSSDIRKNCRQGVSVESKVPGAVLEYILDKSLYTR
jgi:nicotinate-nucleotide adenylyltransferase